MRGRQGREEPRTEGRIHRNRDEKKWRQAKTNEKEEGGSSVVCLSEQKPLVEVDENHTFVLVRVLNMKYLLKIWWLVVWFFLSYSTES